MSRSLAYRLLAVTALIVVTGAAGPSRASAQQPDRLARARSALPSSAADRLDQILQQAAARGLPTAPLVDKALEGEAKQAPPERILAVVQLLAGNLDRARALLLKGGKPSTGDITATADALRRGVSERGVRALRATQRGRPLALPVQTLADLVQVGVPESQAIALLKAWAARGAHAADLRDLPAAIERMTRSGTLPGQAAQTLAQAMRAGYGGHKAKHGKSDIEPRRDGRSDRPPLSPGAGPPPGRQRPAGESSRRGHG